MARKQGPTTSGGKCKFGKAKTGPRKGMCRMSRRPKK
jgi:hypothetical protein